MKHVSAHSRKAASRISASFLALALTGLASPALASEGEAMGSAASEAAEATSFDLATVSITANDLIQQQGVPTPQAETQQAADAAPPPTPPRRRGPPPTDAKLVVSQFVDFVVTGSPDDTARYGGRADAYINLRGDTWGLDESWMLKIRPEFRWGKSSNGVVGLIPKNTALFRPEGTENYDLSLSVKKTFGNGASLEVGKMNVLDISGTLPIVASDGHFGFQNLGIALPPTAVVPNTLTGAMLEVPTQKVIYRLWVFDPDSQYGRTGFETAFESGVGFLASAAALTRFGGKPGVYNFAVVGSTRSGPAFDILPRALTPPPNGNFGDESGELALQLSGFQYLSLNPNAPGKGIGLFGRFQASMGDPTFLDYSGFIGLAGNPAVRPQDRFGIAFFYYSLTDELVDDIAFRLPIEEEKGMEVFYTVGLPEKFELTFDVQVVDSAIAFRDTGVTAGLRLTKTF
ncbi:carbohydrate porin [Erythrobacter sp. HKB08]|uniref:carbohydrate porin n=1 Tax=Erythrobacter sp. HKB08 TaxID=2502843 RepID=UPI001F282BF9|nr:carbohydrate porin [Erythrobacter sp. HKB08]